MTLDVAFHHGFSGTELDIAFTAGGGLTALFGPSGSGKTTTLKAIAGLLTPDDGRIDLDGTVLFDKVKGIALSPRSRGAGLVFQEPRLFPHLDVKGNLFYGWRRSASRLPKGETDRLIESLDLGPLLKRGVSKLSGGERQRVGLGRALLAGPKLLLLDEPLAALDRPLKEELLSHIERLRDEARMPMLYVSHSVDEVIRLADQVVVLAGGRNIAQGSVFDVFARPELAALVGDQSGAIIEASVKTHHDKDHLTELNFEGHRLLVTRVLAPIGAKIRLRVMARDIAIALDEPKRISANNIFPANIVSIVPGAGANADIVLSCGKARLLAQITRSSVSRLELAPGLPIYAIVKSVTIDLRPREPLMR